MWGKRTVGIDGIGQVKPVGDSRAGIMERDSEGCREREREEEMEVEPVFEVHEVDLDYEFDAVMYFDFTRPETREEARLAELWFVSAAEYPPSREYFQLKP